jgi:hypothetical protein
VQAAECFSDGHFPTMAAGGAGLADGAESAAFEGGGGGDDDATAGGIDDDGTAGGDDDDATAGGESACTGTARSESPKGAKIPGMNHAWPVMRRALTSVPSPSFGARGNDARMHQATVD